MLWIKWKARLIAAGTIALALLAAYFKVKRTGKLEERAKSDARILKAENKSLKETLDGVDKKAEISRSVDLLPPGDASKRLRDKWSRD